MYFWEFVNELFKCINYLSLFLIICCSLYFKGSIHRSLRKLSAWYRVVFLIRHDLTLIKAKLKWKIRLRNVIFVIIDHRDGIIKRDPGPGFPVSPVLMPILHNTQVSNNDLSVDRYVLQSAYCVQFSVTSVVEFWGRESTGSRF